MRILSYIFVILTFGTYAQKASLQFSFEDKMTMSSIDSVKLSVYSSSNEILYKQWTHNNGSFDVALPKNNVIRVKGVRDGYFPLDTLISLASFDRNIKKGKPISFHFLFGYDGQSSMEFDVKSSYSPETAFLSDRISVSDYVIIDEETMVLLAYPKRLKTASELIYFKQDSILSRRRAPESALSLMTDYRNRVYLRCESNDFMMTNEKRLNFNKVSRQEHDNYIQPILDTLYNEQLFFTTYKSHYPAFDIINVDLSDTSHVLLHHVVDTEMMEHYRAEFKWADVRTKLWAWDMENETGIDREIWVGANVFTNSIYYEAPYSEFFLVNDLAYAFDFYKDFMFSYDPYSGEKVDSIAIDFHKNIGKSNWEHKMIQDPITKTIYTFYNDAGYTDVYEINLATGIKQNKFTLFYRYVENIKVYNDEFYYVYRPFESLQKKYLYKEDFRNSNRNLEGQERFNQKNN